MKGRMETELGSILIDTDVIATYAGSVAVECFGIVGMATVSMKDGLVRLLKKDSLKNGIQVTVEDNKISCDRGLWRQHFCGCRQSDQQCQI